MHIAYYKKDTLKSSRISVGDCLGKGNKDAINTITQMGLDGFVMSGKKATWGWPGAPTK